MLRRSETIAMVEKLICVIDDDLSLRKALTGLIASMGYRCCGCDSAEACLASGEAVAADCIVTDIQMPGISGIELKRVLVARGCETPVIMMTGRMDPGLEARAFAAGAFCFLRKPLHAAALADCLERAMSDK